MQVHKTGWTLGHLVDLEFFLREGPLSAAQTARWYAEQIHGTRSDRDDAQRIFHWIERCRQDQPDSPGRWLTRVGRGLYAIALLALLVSGIGLARSVLQFDGFVPINLFVAFGVLVVLPFLLSLSALFFLVGSVLFAESPGTGWGKAMRRKVLLHLVVPVIAAVHRRPAWTRSVRRWIDTLWSRSGLYAKAVGWTGFASLQVCGLVLGLGLFTGILFKGAVDDLSFGWTTTSQLVTAERVAAAVRAVARPWLWVSADWAAPSLADVAGSRYFKKAGVFGLDAQALQSWFPFICVAIVVYGILPRALLALLGWAGVRRAFARLSFQDADSQTLLRQMQGHSLRVSGSAAEADPGQPPKGRSQSGHATAVHAWVHEDVIASVTAAHVDQLLQQHIGHPVRSEPISLDLHADRAQLQSIGALSPETAIVLVLEGWRPCLEQTKDYIRAVRDHAGSDRLVRIALVGKPGGGSMPLDTAHWEAWQESVSGLRDPYIEIVNLCPTHERT